VAWVRFPVPARPTFCVEKGLFSVTLCPGAHCKHCNCTVKLDKKNAVASSLWRLEVGLSVQTRVISQRPVLTLKSNQSKAKEKNPVSHGLVPLPLLNLLLYHTHTQTNFHVPPLTQKSFILKKKKILKIPKQIICFKVFNKL
jgi:hypothetical protein